MDADGFWPEPHLELDPDDHDGPYLLHRLGERVLVVRPDRDGENPGRFVEAYVVPSRDEHLRQHTGRLTGADQAVEQRAQALAEGPPQVSHLLSGRR
ncbi:MFS transporter [Couchioplanes azureus]|uniref:MFS transporter n=1 Tax=Couchioplanes caeruleus TaxID=56438 RepID=UPI0019B8DD3E|nr:MFS transporter [Couchioplanes caeruleus]GGQ48462.1 hypothetical protein GCM10010166_15870 [Couchioplanes caeruleus subsp. azureus]